MGFLSRLFIPRGVRRALHPVRSAKRAVRKAEVPKSVRRATYAASQIANPVSALKYHAVERPLTTALRSGSTTRSAAPAPVYRHGKCAVKHRSPEAARRCRNR
ncbi:hypothetical protein [Micromonospora sp. NPDC007230]|uniref:hypothetical protein n=1 Tax=Micromonospora sp. NPDC007230 TaxID=3364237 RepID=UPI0036C91C38